MIDAIPVVVSIPDLDGVSNLPDDPCNVVLHFATAEEAKAVFDAIAGQMGAEDDAS